MQTSMFRTEQEATPEIMESRERLGRKGHDEGEERTNPFSHYYRQLQDSYLVHVMRTTWATVH